jgi:hypothetical protein
MHVRPGFWRPFWTSKLIHLGVMTVNLLSLLADVLGAVFGYRTVHTSSAACSGGGLDSGGGSSDYAIAPPVPPSLTTSVPVFGQRDCGHPCARKHQQRAGPQVPDQAIP